MTVYSAPGREGSSIEVASRYGHYIGGEWVDPVKGAYFENISPVNGKPFTEIARGTAEDIEAALDAAHAAAPAWGRTSATERSNVLLKIADRMEANLEDLAVDRDLGQRQGGPRDAQRRPAAGDRPLPLLRRCAARPGGLDQRDRRDHHRLPLPRAAGRGRPDHPVELPDPDGGLEAGAGAGRGQRVVLKPAEQTPWSILKLMELIGDLLPAGVLNVVNGFGVEAGKPLASSSRIAKIAFTGETTTGRLIMQYASQNIIPVTLELGGKSPNIFFEDVAAERDAFYDKALEGFTMFALNQGEVCTCPSRALVQRSIYSDFVPDAIARVEAIKQGDPLDTETMMGAQASNDQLEKILSYLDIGKQEGAKVLTGGERNVLEGDLAEGYYVQPTVFEGDNSMRIFQEEIFGPVVALTSFDDEADALKVANDTLYGLGAGVWTRDGSRAFRAGKEIQAGRVWTNCYHAYPAHAAFGGYKQSGIGRENHKMMLDHYQQTKNLLVSYSPDKLGFF